jgi:hypothetical protein
MKVAGVEMLKVRPTDRPTDHDWASSGIENKDCTGLILSVCCAVLQEMLQVEDEDTFHVVRAKLDAYPEV